MVYKIKRTEEFINWLSRLPEKLRLQVTARVSRIELHGHFGDTNTVGDGLFELKWKSGLRVYYVHTERFELTLLLGGEKHGQNKDIKKAKNSSVGDFPIVRLKPGVKTTSWHPGKEMANPKKVIGALFQSLVDGDTEAFKEILQAHLEARNITKLAKESGISRRTIYAALSKEGNPSLDTIAKLVHQAFSKVS